MPLQRPRVHQDYSTIRPAGIKCFDAARVRRKSTEGFHHQVDHLPTRLPHSHRPKFEVTSRITQHYYKHPRPDVRRAMLDHRRDSTDAHPMYDGEGNPTTYETTYDQFCGRKSARVNRRRPPSAYVIDKNNIRNDDPQDRRILQDPKTESILYDLPFDHRPYFFDGRAGHSSHRTNSAPAWTRKKWYPGQSVVERYQNIPPAGHPHHQFLMDSKNKDDVMRFFNDPTQRGNVDYLRAIGYRRLRCADMMFVDPEAAAEHGKTADNPLERPLSRKYFTHDVRLRPRNNNLDINGQRSDAVYYGPMHLYGDQVKTHRDGKLKNYGETEQEFQARARKLGPAHPQRPHENLPMDTTGNPFNRVYRHPLGKVPKGKDVPRPDANFEKRSGAAARDRAVSRDLAAARAQAQAVMHEDAAPRHRGGNDHKKPTPFDGMSDNSAARIDREFKYGSFYDKEELRSRSMDAAAHYGKDESASSYAGYSVENDSELGPYGSGRAAEKVRNSKRGSAHKPYSGFFSDFSAPNLADPIVYHGSRRHDLSAYHGERPYATRLKSRGPTSRLTEHEADPDCTDAVGIAFRRRATDGNIINLNGNRDDPTLSARLKNAPRRNSKNRGRRQAQKGEVQESNQLKLHYRDLRGDGMWETIQMQPRRERFYANFPPRNKTPSNSGSGGASGRASGGNLSGGKHSAEGGSSIAATPSSNGGRSEGSDMRDNANSRLNRYMKSGPNNGMKLGGNKNGSKQRNVEGGPYLYYADGKSTGLVGGRHRGFAKGGLQNGSNIRKNDCIKRNPDGTLWRVGGPEDGTTEQGKMCSLFGSTKVALDDEKLKKIRTDPRPVGRPYLYNPEHIEGMQYLDHYRWYFNRPQVTEIENDDAPWPLEETGFKRVKKNSDRKRGDGNAGQQRVVGRKSGNRAMNSGGVLGPKEFEKRTKTIADDMEAQPWLSCDKNPVTELPVKPSDHGRTSAGMYVLHADGGQPNGRAAVKKSRGYSGRANRTAETNKGNGQVDCQRSTSAPPALRNAQRGASTSPDSRDEYGPHDQDMSYSMMNRNEMFDEKFNDDYSTEYTCAEPTYGSTFPIRYKEGKPFFVSGEPVLGEVVPLYEHKYMQNVKGCEPMFSTSSQIIGSGETEWAFHADTRPRSNRKKIHVRNPELRPGDNLITAESDALLKGEPYMTREEERM